MILKRWLLKLFPYYRKNILDIHACYMMLVLDFSFHAM